MGFRSSWSAHLPTPPRLNAEKRGMQVCDLAGRGQPRFGADRKPPPGLLVKCRAFGLLEAELKRGLDT